MSVTLKAGAFEGPLHLLLELIDQQKLPITEVALAAVTEQYLQYLGTLSEQKPEALADFLVIATRLVYLKSRELLPELTNEDDGPSLAEQLRLYQRFVAASQQVLRRWHEGHLAYGRVEPPVKLAEFVLPKNASSENLLAAYQGLLARLKPVAPLPEVSIDRTVSLRERIQKIFERLTEWKKLSWRELFRGAWSKTEVIVGFLAILELVKQNKVSVYQGEVFGDMEIEPIK